MFTSTFVPNPLHVEGAKTAQFVQVHTCTCGSTDVAKGYTNDSTGEVDGMRLTCRVCKASETF